MDGKGTRQHAESTESRRFDPMSQDPKGESYILSGFWLVAASLVILLLYIGWRVQVVSAATETPGLNSLSAQQVNQAQVNGDDPDTANLPGLVTGDLADQVLSRKPEIFTLIPNRPREDVIKHIVEAGDSIFAISKIYNVTPETILWANYDLLRDSPDALSIGMELNIPPVNGVYYTWKEGDSLESVADLFKAKVDDILDYSGNRLDLTDPQVTIGQQIMIPGGEREFQSWVVPHFARENSGVSPSVYGAGACTGNYEGAYGSGYFIWPSYNHFLSGNDFWSGHLGIDIAGATGDPVWASDAGVIVFAGWAQGGYGNMVMVDHGNGYQTLYAHLSAVRTYCGKSVAPGTVIGSIGSTGNSTGPHLHFEIRVWGQFINPWQVLP
jgi:LysM repeat protein